MPVIKNYFRGASCVFVRPLGTCQCSCSYTKWGLGGATHYSESLKKVDISFTTTPEGDTQGHILAFLHPTDFMSHKCIIKLSVISTTVSAITNILTHFWMQCTFPRLHFNLC